MLFSICTVGVSTCMVDVLTCMFDIFTYTVVLTCFVDVFTCMVEVSTCVVDVFTRNVDVFTSMIDVFTCVVDDVTCIDNAFVMHNVWLVAAAYEGEGGSRIQCFPGQCCHTGLGWEPCCADPGTLAHLQHHMHHPLLHVVTAGASDSASAATTHLPLAFNKAAANCLRSGQETTQ